MKFFLFFLCAFLIACNKSINKESVQADSVVSRYTARPDGPPAQGAPVLAQAVLPKNEPLSRYGNRTSYSVNGITYDVMPASSGYSQQGIASWYGTRFHQHSTSSGEPYDMYALTAAHKTLPLPTYVNVKNLSNGREIMVKVNDRGPFVGKRIIDLSYAAARQLGMLPKGTAPVEVSAVTVRNGRTQKKAGFYIQAGAFDTKTRAEILRHQITAFISSPVHIEHRSPYYLVKIGPFKDRASVNVDQQKLNQHGIHDTFASLA